MDDPVAVPLERRPHVTWLLLALATERLVGAHGARRERRLLERPHALRERVGDPACDLHYSSVLPVAARSWPRAGRQNARDWPPSTTTEVPTTHEARSETRNATTSAISSTVPNRPHGISRSTNAAIASGSSR